MRRNEKVSVSDNWKYNPYSNNNRRWSEEEERRRWQSRCCYDFCCCCTIAWYIVSNRIVMFVDRFLVNYSLRNLKRLRDRLQRCLSRKTTLVRIESLIVVVWFVVLLFVCYVLATKKPLTPATPKDDEKVFRYIMNSSRKTWKFQSIHDSRQRHVDGHCRCQMPHRLSKYITFRSTFFCLAIPFNVAQSQGYFAQSTVRLEARLKNAVREFVNEVIDSIRFIRTRCFFIDCIFQNSRLTNESSSSKRGTPNSKKKYSRNKHIFFFALFYVYLDSIY